MSPRAVHFQVPTRRGKPSTATFAVLGNQTYPNIRASPWIIKKAADVTLLNHFSTNLAGSVAADMDMKSTARAEAKEAKAAKVAESASATATPTKAKTTRGNGGSVVTASSASASPKKDAAVADLLWLEDCCSIIDRALEHSGVNAYDDLRYRVIHFQSALEFCYSGQACIVFTC